MSEHTPGPWERGNNEGFWGQNCCIEADTEIGPVVVCDFVHSSAVEEDANAALIAAAPDLLAACKIITEARVESAEEFIIISLTHQEWQQLRAAIARAGGER
jgi:hypothetical protein